MEQQMIDLIKVYETLKNARVEFVSGVPDTLLNDFCLGLETHWDRRKHVLAANEGNAVALAAGYHLATNTVPLVYMQNSGMGNSLNPLISLTDRSVYSIPLVLLIGWRGDPESGDWPQHERQGELSPILLDALKIPYKTLGSDEKACLASIEWSVKEARTMSQPAALLVKKGVLAKKEKAGFDKTGEIYNLSREEAIKIIISELPDDTIFVGSTGRITRELYALRDLLGKSHKHDFLNVGAMGHALSIAAGIAAAKPERTVVCLDGDAAALMHMGSIPVTASLKLRNLLHIVLNNGSHESVGGQQSVSYSANLTGIAAKSGYHTLDGFVNSAKDLQAGLIEVRSSQTSAFLEVRIRKGMRSNMPILRANTIALKEQFLQSVSE